MGSIDYIHKASNLEVSYDAASAILFLNWIGFQSVENIHDSGELVLRYFTERKCSKVLNDNRQVVGPWHHSAEWAAMDWFPRMIDAGLKHFAWVCSSDFFSQLSAKRALPEAKGIVKRFDTYEEALAWLTALPA